MRRLLTAALATAAISLTATSAQAAQFLQCGVNAPSGSSCISDTDNVNLNTASGVGQTGNPGTGYIVPSGPNIEIYSTDTGGLNIDASGQATITAVDGRLNNITFMLLTGAIGVAEFNLNDIGNQDFDVTIITRDALGAIIQTSTTFNATFNGSNRFGIVAGPGETLAGFTINSTTGFGSLTQLRLRAAGAVPEPATWAMMLLGFGGIGMTMRRKQRRNGALMQVA